MASVLILSVNESDEKQLKNSDYCSLFVMDFTSFVPFFLKAMK